LVLFIKKKNTEKIPQKTTPRAFRAPIIDDAIASKKTIPPQKKPPSKSFINSAEPLPHPRPYIV
jgi:hypothetical protein